MWAAIILTTLAYLQWVERKVIAHIQVRLGPSRVGPHGLLQPLADVIKLLTKEDLVPPQANKFSYVLAPFLAVALALLPVAVIPFGPEVEIFGIRTSHPAHGPEHRHPVPAGHIVARTSTASRWPAGPPTASTRCSAACAARRR